MTRLTSIVGSAVVLSLVYGVPGASAQVPDRRAGADAWVGRIARVLPGSIEGTVQDERGRPLGGATVSALGGASSALAVTDGLGHYSLRALPPGAYLVRAHLSGFIASRRQFVDVRSSGPTRFSMELRRVDAGGDPASPGQPNVLAAGFGVGTLGDPDPAPGLPAAAVDEDQSETAWRLRHLRRSVLKHRSGQADPADVAPESGSDWFFPDTLSSVARALGSSARAASVALSGLPVSGEVNLLTTGSFDDPSALASPEVLSRSVAYVSVGGPAWEHGDWTGQALITQAVLGSWFVGGSYRRREAASHRYDVGFSYSSQAFAAGPTGHVLPAGEGTRHALSISASDRWRLSPWLSVDGGARLSRYSYLEGRGQVSPHIAMTLVPAEGLRLRSLVARRVLAPGAEEFLQPLAVGLWVPPGRTFLDVSCDAPFTSERTRHVEVSVERDLLSDYVVSVRTFYQRVADQQMTMFGGGVVRPLVGQYEVTSAGDLHARGISVGLANAGAGRVRGAVHYELTTIDWVGPPDSALAEVLAPWWVRTRPERVHDVTTSVETEFPETATRVFVLYRLNTAFARSGDDGIRPGLDGRFDVQVMQRLPFLDFTSAHWQFLVAVRNFFRETAPDASVADELSIVRPPTRVVGGVLVRF